MEPKTCRICLEEEQVDRPLISPCLCRGGIQYVHRECLQRWRQVRLDMAYYQCDVCRFRYRFHRLWWGKLLESRWTSGLLSLGLMMIAGFLSGQASARLCNRIWAILFQAPTDLARLQVLFHGMCWLAIPGIFLMLMDSLRAENGSWRWLRLPRPPRPEPNHKPDEKDRVVPYKSPSFETWFWVCVLVGRFAYTLFGIIDNYCKQWCVHAQQLVENI